MTTQLPATVANSAAFKRMRMRHRRVLALHLAGKRNFEIAAALRLSDAYVGHVLRRDDSKALCAPVYAERIEQLVPKAIDALERNMRCGDSSTEVRAADIALKVAGRYSNTDEGKSTAEDVIERVLERIAPDGSRTRATERRVVRMKGDIVEPPTPVDS